MTGFWIAVAIGASLGLTPQIARGVVMHTTLQRQHREHMAEYAKESMGLRVLARLGRNKATAEVDVTIATSVGDSGGFTVLLPLDGSPEEVQIFGATFTVKLKKFEIDMDPEEEIWTPTA
jgi:hypothetical protein